MKSQSKRKKRYFWAVGRRKEAVATIRLYEGKGKWQVNGKPIEEYFPGEVMKAIYQRPLVVGQCQDKFWGEIRVKGGGKKSQVQATALALARALTKYNEAVYRPLMRKEGLLTVDARARERRKAGQMGRARKKKQSPKR